LRASRLRRCCGGRRRPNDPADYDRASIAAKRAGEVAAASGRGTGARGYDGPVTIDDEILRPLSDAELLEIISACLSAAYDRDPLRVLDVLAVRVPGSTQRLAVAGLAFAVVGAAGRPGPGAGGGGGQLLAELEVERLDALWSSPAAGGACRRGRSATSSASASAP
jgi:hypothetical protein